MDELLQQRYLARTTRRGFVLSAPFYFSPNVGARAT